MNSFLQGDENVFPTTMRTDYLCIGTTTQGTMAGGLMLVQMKDLRIPKGARYGQIKEVVVTKEEDARIAGVQVVEATAIRQVVTS